MLEKIKKYLRHFMELGLLLLGISVFAEILFGPDDSFFWIPSNSKFDYFCLIVLENLVLQH